MLTETSVRASDRRAIFVGVEAYETAGGTVARDLFQGDDGGWLEDVALLERLVGEKLQAEDLLAERGVIVSRETVRLWVNRFGAHFANCIRRDRPAPSDEWHLDEVVIPIRSRKHWLWRAVYANGDTLDILVQTRRNAKAAKCFLARLIARFGRPRVVITDKLRSYFAPLQNLAPGADHRAHKGLNNRIEGSHRRCCATRA